MRHLSGIFIFVCLLARVAWGQNVAEPLPLPANGHRLEYIILCGAPSLEKWEKFKNEPHDKYWGCFIRSSRTRIQQIQKILSGSPGATITLLIYLDGYVTRSAQEKRDLVALVYTVRDKYRINLVPIRNGRDVIAYLNHGQPRASVKIASLEYFGHSNQKCFMFDYSNQVASGSKSWLHEDDLAALKRNLFVRDSFVKSWGCHTGESMSEKFWYATDTRMIGAIGRTDYANRDDAVNGIVPILSSPGGRWVK